VPASHHAGASSITFVDGHAEVHRWRSATTLLPVRYAFVPQPLDDSGLADYRWLRERTTVTE
jgi:prepilin-type processing-associated H-X9-DG protein